jgi:hypothetical protein
VMGDRPWSRPRVQPEGFFCPGVNRHPAPLDLPSFDHIRSLKREARDDHGDVRAPVQTATPACPCEALDGERRIWTCISATKPVCSSQGERERDWISR